MNTNNIGKGSFVIIDFSTMDYMKDESCGIKVYGSYNDAYLDCSMYELEDVWIVQLFDRYREAVIIG